MATYFVRFAGTVGLLVLSLSLILSPGCSQEQVPPPVQAPPAAVAPQPGAAPAPGTPQSGAAPAAQPAAGGAVMQNVSQIQVGMTQEQIQQLMGAPGQTKQKGQVSEWKYYTPQGKVEIKFQNNQVIAVEKH
jgi:hypothetical protein